MTSTPGSYGAEPDTGGTVTATYLHLPDRSRFRPAYLDDGDLVVMQAREPLPAFYRFLYSAVGGDYLWVDRLSWTDANLQCYLSRPSVTLLVLYARGTPAGYIELDSDSDEPGTEIRYFGIIPAFHGRGYGKHLLSVGVERAFQDGAERIWLSTRSTDGPHALANYLARGFMIYRTETEPAPVGAASAYTGDDQTADERK